MVSDSSARYLIQFINLAVTVTFAPRHFRSREWKFHCRKEYYFKGISTFVYDKNMFYRINWSETIYILGNRLLRSCCFQYPTEDFEVMPTRFSNHLQELTFRNIFHSSSCGTMEFIIFWNCWFWYCGLLQQKIDASRAIWQKRLIDQVTK